MPSTRDIRRRIKSVKNTAQITKAMQMVAAAKMRKAQSAAVVGRPYAQLLNEIMAEAATRTVGFDHPLLTTRPVAKRAVIVVGTDRGLCGGLNSNLFREAAKLDKDRSPRSRTAILRLANLRELAFDVAIARHELQRDGAAPETYTALRAQTLQGLDEAKIVLSRLIEAEDGFAERIAASQQARTAHRA